MFKRAACLISFCLALGTMNVRAQLAPDHIVVVIMENHAYSQIIGSPNAPYINNVLVRKGALLTHSYGVEHPSQPNYLDIFSGSNQGVINDAVPLNTPFSTPNLAAKLIAAGLTFATYSETLPSVGFTGASFTDEPGKNKYARKHNPAVNWQAEDAPANNHLPASANLPFTEFPTDAAGYDALPTVSFVIPNEQHDMHDGSVAAGDTWLRRHLEGYRIWAMTHHSVLVLTFDEDDRHEANRIATVFAGQPIMHGRYSEAAIEPTPGAGVDHFTILRTLERRYQLGVCNAATDGARQPITDIFRHRSTAVLANSSTRARIGRGDEVAIGGFTISGPSKKRIVLRGIGPSLQVNGVPLQGALSNPTLELHKSDGTIIATNDDWEGAQQSEIQVTGLAPRDSREAAMVVSLDRGDYTVMMAGRNGGAGIGVVELYDIEPQSLSVIRNLATRARVGAGGDAMIAGFIVDGSDFATVVVRALGPSLEGTAAIVGESLADPGLELFDRNGNAVAANDNWQESQRVEIEATRLAPRDSSESAILASLPPGSYTAVLTSKDKRNGLALIETYKLE